MDVGVTPATLVREVVYWLDLDNDSYYVTKSLGGESLDSMVRSIALAGR